MVFPSEGELRLLGLDDDTLAACGAIVCTTQGAAGATVRVCGSSVDVPAPPVREVDPTGAGDTFAGAFIAALPAGADPVEATSVGCAVAAPSVQVLGPMEAPVDRSHLSVITRRA